MQLLYIFLGGGTGSLLRFSVAWLLRSLKMEFPIATFTANALSCIILGALLEVSAQGNLPGSTRSFFIVGLCGGFSTFSTFSYETLELIQQQKYGIALSYVFLSLFLCMCCLLIGIRLAKLSG